MKKIFTVLFGLWAFVGVTKAAKPVELREFKASSYNCAYFDWWYFGYGESGRFGFVIFDAEGKEVAFTVMSPEESDLCAYYDNIDLQSEQYEDRDTESHYYMSTHWVLNSPDGVRWAGDINAAIPECVYEKMDDEGNSLFALQPGTYYFRVMEILIDSETGKASMGDGFDQVQFTITSHTIKNLKATVASNHQTATISWSDSTTFPAETYLYMNIQSGADVIFDNYVHNISARSPLTVPVTDGRTYCVTAQCLNYNKEPQGQPVTMYFTVGTNAYIPTNLEASVKQDTVTFRWDATNTADGYCINVYQNGRIYASYTATEQQLTKKLPSGSYTWEVAAYEKKDEQYYQITEYIQGNEFTTVSTPLPEGTIEMNVLGMDAVLIEEYNNRFEWLIEFATGSTNGTGYPMPWIVISADRELAISGTYSPALGNLAISAQQGEDTQMNMDGTQSNTIQAIDAELKLEFEGFDSEYKMEGYDVPYYSGYFKMTLANGFSYYAQFSNLMCKAYPIDEWMTGIPNTIYSMTGEDPSIPIVAATGISLSRTDATLNAGQTIELTATVVPSNATNKAIIWETSDPSVATVENGLVTAVAKGVATISVTTVDGGFTATCRVMVNEDYTLSYDVTPANAGYVEIKGTTLNAKPNNGYHFVRWNDGITTNPRTIQLTRDTTFTAYFALDNTGYCGKDYALTWTYNTSTKTLTISGNGTFDEHMECGLEAKQKMESLIIDEGVTAIGAQAFSNCSNLTFVQLPASLQIIGARAFYYDINLTSIYNYRPNPCIIETNTFEKVNRFDCILYVLAESVSKYKSENSDWKIFDQIKPIGGTTVEEPITDVETQPNNNNVVVTWPVSTDANTYTLQITKDGIVFCTLIFDANGQLKGIAFAPARDGRNHAPAAVKTSNGGLRFTVTGLDSGTQYHLKVDAKNDLGVSIATYETNFETQTISDTATSIDQISQEPIANSQKLIKDGQILILRGDKTYTLQGQEVK